MAGEPGVCRVTRPDQDLPCSSHRQPLAIDDFVLDILQGGIVELKLPLEGPVGHAAPLAQEHDDLIHHCDKVHPVSSLPGARPPCS